MAVINTNVASLNSQAAIAINQRGLAKSMQELSTGKRIVSAADDAAGLAISDKLTAQIRGLNQAVRNANDAISMLQTAEGATGEITNMLQRMRELAVQSANDTNGSAERSALQSEYSALRTEIDRISATTKFGNIGVLDGTAGSASDGAVTFQVGATSDSDNQVSFTFSDFSTGSSGITSDVASDDLTTLTGAQAALDNVDLALTAVNAQRATMGAMINRFQYTVDNLTNISVHSAESRSRIVDADYSQASANLSKHQIIQQAATAMLAQANQQPQSVLTLLK
jgi:flagellin